MHAHKIDYHIFKHIILFDAHIVANKALDYFAVMKCDAKL